MMCRRFFAVAAAILLCFALFCGSFAHSVFADVVHAYRKPSEADLQWLLDVDPVSASELPDIVQVGFSAPSNRMLMPRRGPCSPAANVPSSLSSVPPLPQTADSTISTGLAPEPDGVVNIAPIVVDSAAPVVQMTGERLPPPSEVPTEQSLVAPLTVSTTAPAPIPAALPNGGKHSWNVSDHSIVEFDGGCGVPRNYKPRLFVPDMLGSSAWLTGYSVGTNNMEFVLPTMLLIRPNVVERFNASVQNRIWADYRQWNNAVSVNDKSRAVDQFSFGLEKQILRRSSVELRVPMISQFASKQTTGNPVTSVELGNVSVFVKQVLHQNSRWTVSGGTGVTMPTAEDCRLPVVAARLKNNTYYLVSFLGVQWHPNKNMFGHFVMQADLPIEKNEWVVGGVRQKIEGQQVVRTGFQLGHWIYRMDHCKRPCRLGVFAEVNYAVVTDGSPRYVLNNDVYVSGFDTGKSALTAAVGVPMVFGKLTCTNAFTLPISGGQRPFSVGYSFSLSRQF